MYLNAGCQFLGLSLREALLLPVGLLWDLVELEFRRRGMKKGPETGL